jgi:alkylhydroperoxidase family enzyme
LHRYALQGCQNARRDRAEALRIERLARGTLFPERERGALGLTEAVTLIVQTGITEDVIENASSVFSPEELTRLLYLIIEINAWNRLAVPTASPEPGSYTSPD